MANSIKVENNKDKIELLLADAVDKALYTIGEQWLSTATQIATQRYSNASGGSGVVDTGRFRASLSFITADGKDGGNSAVNESEPGDQLSGSASKATVIVGSNVEYAGFIETGTSKMEARPVVAPAVTENKNNFKKIVSTTLKNA